MSDNKNEGTDSEEERNGDSFPEGLQSLIDDFELFSFDLICKVWDDQQADTLACRDILRALPADFETEPLWLQQLRLQQEAAARTHTNDGKATYRDILLIPKEENEEETETVASVNRAPWRPKLLITKDISTLTSKATTANNDYIDDEDERERQWMICCDGSRDTLKRIGGAKRKFHASKLFVKKP